MLKIKPFILAIGLMLAPSFATAQTPASTAPAPVAAPAASPVQAAPAEAKPAKAPETTIGTSKSDPMVGQPIEGRIGLQPQVTKLGEQAARMHDYILVPVMAIISLLVLGLLLYVMARFRRAANPVASKTSHNTVIEVVWTLVPVLVLVGIAIPSISLLAAQFKPAPANAVTLKAIGNQWFWSYEYPDYGVSFDANMLSDEDAKAKGEPRLLAVDNRVVLPVNTPIKLVTTGNDVIHSWAVPAFWIKLDTVPGRLNETTFTIDKKGVYYGQCSELCGDRHGFMPIGVEAVSKEDFAAWIRAKGGKMPGDAAAPPAAPTTAEAGAPAAAPNAAPAAAKN
ncbi:cytochrome c oxidase subunit II [Aquisediminimonas profunda]|uniref:cytochrome c oxidase subunit II n=1 Tax=Aquisediminimonas profunda TaxID=1550733 RepID=UPI001C6280D3|nr:cytochrome c oxidase subunit II [Aquisediminimonas profunda]